MSDFNFYTFLLEKGYEKKVIRDASNVTFCTNYQKELTDDTWNSLTVHKDKTFSAAGPKCGLVYKEQPQPTSLGEAETILMQIEDLPDEIQEN